MTINNRHLLLIVGMLLCASWASAQEAANFRKDCLKFRKHEIGANLFSWFQMDFQTRAGDQMSYANGLLYKLHLGQNVLRAGADVFRYSYETRSEGSIWYYHTEGRYRVIEARVGYERRLTRGKLQPFLGIEFAYQWQKKEGSYDGNGGFYWPSPSYSGTTNELTRRYFLAPMIGLAYRPTRRISISMEGRCCFGAARVTYEVTQVKSIWGDFSCMDPVRTVSVSYHF